MNEGMEDLKQIEDLQEKNQKLGKQVEMLQFACREAGAKIKKLEDQLKTLADPLTQLRKDGL